MRSFKQFLRETAEDKGAFHRWLGKSEDEPITAADIAKGKAAGGHAAKMAIQAQNFHPHKFESVVDEDVIEEGLRKVSEHEHRGRKAVVYRNREYDEYQVKFHHNGQHLKDADSFHNDKSDAQGTARHWISHAHPENESVNESREPHKRGTKVTVNGKRGEISHIQFPSPTYKHWVNRVQQTYPHAEFKHSGSHAGEIETHAHHGGKKVGSYGHKDRTSFISYNEEIEQLDEGMPIKGHPYHTKSDAELHYIHKDASEAARAMRNHNSEAEMKYLDQANDAATVLHYRRKGGKRVTAEEVVVEDIASITKVGDHVHLGFGARGGAGYRGHVIKVEGHKVHVKQHDSDVDPKWGARTWVGPMNHITVEKSVKEEVDEGADIQTMNDFIVHQKKMYEYHRVRANSKILGNRTKQLHGMKANEHARIFKNLSDKHVHEEVIDETKRVPNSKEQLEKAIAMAERKAAKTQVKQDNSYLEMLKKALRRIKGRKRVAYKDVSGFVEDVGEHNVVQHDNSKTWHTHAAALGAEIHAHSTPGVRKAMKNGKVQGVWHGNKGWMHAYGTNEETEISETLAPDATAADYIHDFVHSKNNMFKGDSKKERIRRALGAYYGKKNEEVAMAHENYHETSPDPKLHIRTAFAKHYSAARNKHDKTNPRPQSHAKSLHAAYVHISNRFGPEAEAYMRAERAKAFNEEVITELSKKTLGSYVKKAAYSAAMQHAHSQGAFVNATHSFKDPEKRKSHEWDGYNQNIKDTVHYRAKGEKRLKGVDRATDKLTK